MQSSSPYDLQITSPPLLTVRDSCTLSGVGYRTLVVLVCAGCIAGSYSVPKTSLVISEKSCYFREGTYIDI